MSWTETVASNRRISASAEGILAGCEIKENWRDDRNNICHALAVMEKSKTINIYSDIIERVSKAITEALNVPNKNSIQGYNRYKVAAVLAKDIESCISVIRFVGGSSSVPAGLKSENEYLIEASNISNAIPVRVVITRGANFDNNGRIQSAFAKSIAEAGFKTGTAASSPYTLEVTLSLTEAPSAQNIFVRYEITANFIQTNTKQGVAPAYSIDGREGHTTLINAQNRAISAAETRINEEYTEMLKESFSKL